MRSRKPYFSALAKMNEAFQEGGPTRATAILDSSCLAFIARGDVRFMDDLIQAYRKTVDNVPERREPRYV